MICAMKNCSILLLIFTLIPCLLSSQPLEPVVTWDFSSKKIDANLYEVHLTANIKSGWHIYSQYNEGGPGPARISFKKNSLLVRQFEPREIGKPEHMEEALFDARVFAFSDRVDFVQVVKKKKERPTSISGKIVFMACNGDLCLPPKEESFTLELN
jgi:thiol:disulfide interchange protein DsbD